MIARGHAPGSRVRGDRPFVFAPAPPPAHRAAGPGRVELAVGRVARTAGCPGASPLAIITGPFGAEDIPRGGRGQPLRARRPKDVPPTPSRPGGIPATARNRPHPGSRLGGRGGFG